jgi:hypothetical protein
MIIRDSRLELTRLMPNPIKDPGSMPSTGHPPPGSDPGSNNSETTAPGPSDSASGGSGHPSLADSALSLHQFTTLIAALSAENRELRESAMRFGDLAERLAKELRNEKANRRLGARDERETRIANTESTPGGARLENR